MKPSNFIPEAGRKIRALRQDKRGNVAIIFAMTTFPIFILTGFALDLQQVNTARNKVQHILDSAVIAGAREMQEGATDSEINNYVKNYIEASIRSSGGSYSCDDPVSTVTSGEQDISVTIDCAQPTSLMQLVGTNQLNFGVTSASTYGIGKVDIAMVFDVSGSMDWDGKMEALKVAAEDAVDVLLPPDSNLVDTGDVRIAMTSYSSMVDAGDFFHAVTNENKTRTYTDSYDVTRSEDVYVCTRYRRNGSCRSGYWDRRYYTETVNVSKTITNTCVKERNGTEAFTDADPGPFAWIEPAVAKYNQSYWGGSWSEETCNEIPPLPLTSDRQDLLDYIDDLEPNGGTAGHLGIAWGWYMIAEDWASVWPNGSDPWAYDEPDTAKAMILMTDGDFLNWHNPDEGHGDSFDQAMVLCDAIKDEGIRIYTVAFQAPSQGQEILSYCASGEDFAFEPDNADELQDAYTKIAQSISDLRIRY